MAVKDRSVEAQCRGKFRHQGRAAAKKEARRLGGVSPTWHFRAYRCCHCGCWHVGHGVSHAASEKHYVLQRDDIRGA